MKPRFLISILFISACLSGCSNARSDKSGTPAIFDSKLEAEMAAKDFGCIGAHKMKDKWMPCEKHGNNHNHHNH